MTHPGSMAMLGVMLDDPATTPGPGSRHFWKAQLIAWVMVALVYYLAVLPESGLDALRLLAFKLVWAATGVAVSAALARVFGALGLSTAGPVRGLGFAATLGIPAGVLWVLALGAMARAVTGVPDMIYTPRSFPFVALNHVLILLAWGGAWLALAYWRRSVAEERKSFAAMSHARSAELEMLRYQLNPHFLFNALTSVRSLISERPAEARETVTRLADFLRATLHPHGGTTATVAEELQVVADYLAIEKVRFEEHLQVELRLDSMAATSRIPSFLLHSLVENAVKHGRQLDGRLRISLSASLTEAGLVLVVENSGRYAPAADPVGRVGLSNLRERLEGLYPGRHRFSLVQVGEMVRATVLIQVRKSPDAA